MSTSNTITRTDLVNILNQTMFSAHSVEYEYVGEVGNSIYSSTWTAPDNGIIVAIAQWSNAHGSAWWYITDSSNSGIYVCTLSTDYANQFRESASFPVIKGHVYTTSSGNSSSLTSATAYFYRIKERPLNGGAYFTASVTGSTGKLYLYRFGDIVYFSSNGAFRSSSSSIANGTVLSQTIPSGYRPVAVTYNIIPNNGYMMLQFSNNGNIAYYGASAWNVNAYVSGMWVTNDSFPS